MRSATISMNSLRTTSSLRTALVFLLYLLDKVCLNPDTISTIVFLSSNAYGI